MATHRQTGGVTLRWPFLTCPVTADLYPTSSLLFPDATHSDLDPCLYKKPITENSSSVNHISRGSIFFASQGLLEILLHICVVLKVSQESWWQPFHNLLSCTAAIRNPNCPQLAAKARILNPRHEDLQGWCSNVDVFQHLCKTEAAGAHWGAITHHQADMHRIWEMFLPERAGRQSSICDDGSLRAEELSVIAARPAVSHRGKPRSTLRDIWFDVSISQTGYAVTCADELSSAASARLSTLTLIRPDKPCLLLI